MKKRSTAQVVLEELRRAGCRKRLSARTAKAYERWAKRYLHFRSDRELTEMGDAEVNGFLKEIATSGLSRSTQSQALSSLRFLYDEVFNTRLGEVEEIVSPHRQREAPAALSLSEFQLILANAEGMDRLIFKLLFGAGLRLVEALALRVRDINFNEEQIHIRDKDGDTKRVAVLPGSLGAELQQQVRNVRALHSEDLHDGYGRILIPYTLWKQNPSRAREWQWQYVFPAPRRTRDPRKGVIRRNQLSARTVNRRLAEAVAQGGIKKAVSCSSLRRSFGYHLVATGCDPELVKELLGFRSVKTVTSYGPARSGSWIRSPLELL